MSGGSFYYNPTREEQTDDKPHACLWELLRRNREFQLDSKIWVDSWNKCEDLLDIFGKLNDQQKHGKQGKKNQGRRIQLRNQLFAIKHGCLPYFVWEPTQPGQPANSVEPTPQQLKATRAWKRAEYIHCALSWLLPPVEWSAPLPSTDTSDDRRIDNPDRPEEFRPELDSKQMEENRRYCPLHLDMEWPLTPPSFRQAFIRAATPGWEGDKVEEFDLHELAMRLLRIGSLIPSADSNYPPPSAQELEQAKHALYAVACGKLGMMRERFKCFIIPSSTTYRRSQFDQVIAEIEKHFEIYPDGLYPKASYLGRDNQWDAFLIAEDLPRKGQHLDYHETAREIVALREKMDVFDVKSRAASKIEADVKDRCNAIEHWIRCVYPHLNPRPFVSRKGRKTLPEKS